MLFIKEYWSIIAWVLTTAIIPFVARYKKSHNERIEQIEVRLNEIEKANKLQNNALLASMRCELLTDFEKAIAKGYATKYQKMAIYEKKKSYNELGGDSFIDDIYEAEYIVLPDEPPKK